MLSPRRAVVRKEGQPEARSSAHLISLICQALNRLAGVISEDIKLQCRCRGHRARVVQYAGCSVLARAAPTQQFVTRRSFD